MNAIQWNIFTCVYLEILQRFKQVKKTSKYKKIQKNVVTSQYFNPVGPQLLSNNWRANPRHLKLYRITFWMNMFEQLAFTSKTSFMRLKLTRLVTTSVLKLDLYSQACEHKFLYFSKDWGIVFNLVGQTCQSKHDIRS